MRKLLMVLLMAALSVAAQAQTAGAAPASPQAQPAQQRKVIQDPKEYNAYIAALNAKDPKQQAQLMESYLQTYPNSVMKQDGLEILLRAYQQAGDTAHVQSTSQRLLQVDPKNLTALAMLSYLDRAQAQAGGANASASLQEAGKLGARGLEALKSATKPEGYTDEQWNGKLASMRFIFLGSVGHAALDAKDYATAQEYLKQVVALQPTDVNSIYLLALAYLSPNPPVVDGLFWIAKAADSAPQLLPYAKNQYERYHGSDEGFDQLLASAKTATTIPEGFTVTPAPTPADQAADMLKKATPDKLSFAEWQFILTNGAKDVTDQVWTAIQGKPVQLVAVVIAAAPDSLQMAGSVDDIQAKKSDFTLKLKTALAADHLPKAGAELTVQGTPSDYSASPDSFNMIFSDGAIVSGLSDASAKPTKPSAGSYH
jgi:tetratricopeptide (TPR) repeat protein